jgi:hypothetical protein
MCTRDLTGCRVNSGQCEIALTPVSALPRGCGSLDVSQPYRHPQPVKAFIYICIYLTAIRTPEHTVEWRDDYWKMNWKVCGRKRSWPNLRICQQFTETLRKIMTEPLLVQCVTSPRQESGTFRIGSRSLPGSGSGSGSGSVSRHIQREGSGWYVDIFEMSVPLLHVSTSARARRRITVSAPVASC